ncbi:MAG TPA: AAA family ATPase [Pseudomonadales bacterium]|nr:AAA family ATPase [Pseudomonadales bacterium]
MHRISYAWIENFRACKAVGIQLDDFTPLVGQNNVGKSAILDAIKWLLKPEALSTADFNDVKKPLVATACIEGITAKILEQVPEQKHRTAIEPYCPKGVLWIRATATGPKTFSQEVWDPAKADAKGNPKEWRPYPTGLPQAVSALLPEPLFIQAMKDVLKDFTSVAAGTSIKRLIEEIAEPVTKANSEEIQAALKTINDLLTGKGEARSEALKEFDEDATDVLEDFFPGLALQLELPETKIKEFFKSGSLKITEDGREGLIEFSQLGNGAQRAIEMALICFLAKVPADGEASYARKLLLIDEPELYLHPQGVKRVRHALSRLSAKGFQIICTTHSPLMLSRETAAQTVIVRKEPGAGTITRKPLKRAVREAFEDGESQSRVLFELGNLSEIYFAEKVVLCEGKTDRRILPLAYERLYNRTPELDNIAFVSIGSCSDIRKALTVLDAMKITACAIADLDFAFTEATKGGNPLIAKEGGEISKAKSVLQRLQPKYGFSLAANGLPQTNASYRAADTWSFLTSDAEGKDLAHAVHELLKKYLIWVWEIGCIEHITGTAGKGEDAIIKQEQDLEKMTDKDIAKAFPVFVQCFEWVRNLNKQAKVSVPVAEAKK